MTNTVISDRLVFEFNPNNNHINVYYTSPSKPESVEPIEPIILDFKLIALLICTGLIGIVAFGRKQIQSNNDDEDISP